MSSEKLTYECCDGASADEHVYRMNGPMVLGELFSFQAALRAESVNTILDLSAVPYMDSAALGVMTNLHVALQKKGKKLLLVGANERLLTLFQVTKLDQVLKVYPTLEAARSAAA